MENTVIDQINQLEDEKQQLIGKAREEAMTRHHPLFGKP